MVEEARLEAVDSGLTPATEGWFVVNVRDAAWVTRERSGGRCGFEADGPVVRGSDLEVRRFPEFGIKLAVFGPGQPSTLYHAESNQEAFLVLQGECQLLIDGHERRLRAWDFVYCPPGTAHLFVGAGDGPCVLLMVGGRTGERNVVYPESEFARRHGAGGEAEAPTIPHWQLGRPVDWDRLPWA